MRAQILDYTEKSVMNEPSAVLCPGKKIKVPRYIPMCTNYQNPYQCYKKHKMRYRPVNHAVVRAFIKSVIKLEVLIF